MEEFMQELGLPADVPVAIVQDDHRSHTRSEKRTTSLLTTASIPKLPTNVVSPKSPSSSARRGLFVPGGCLPSPPQDKADNLLPNPEIRWDSMPSRLPESESQKIDAAPILMKRRFSNALGSPPASRSEYSEYGSSPRSAFPREGDRLVSGAVPSIRTPPDLKSVPYAGTQRGIPIKSKGGSSDKTLSTPDAPENLLHVLKAGLEGKDVERTSSLESHYQSSVNKLAALITDIALNDEPEGATESI